MRILAIDPGNEFSAWLIYDTASSMPIAWAKDPNDAVLRVIDTQNHSTMFAIEVLASYGMAVGAEVFETAYYIGRCIERWSSRDRVHGEPIQVFRRDVKIHLCGSVRAKDTNVRQAIIDRYGPGKDKAVGLRLSPGPLYGLKADCWAALGVAITAAETRLGEAREAA